MELLSESTYVLRLTQDEAEKLMAIVGKIAGEGELYEFAERVFDALDAASVECDFVNTKGIQWDEVK